jgi:hypothetical protein
MRRPLALVVPLLAALASPVMAQTITYEVVEEETIVDDGAVAADDGAGERFVVAPEAIGVPIEVPHGIASYGPFRVLDEGHAALVDVTDETSVPAFTRMLQDHPGIMTLEMVEAPGTENDRANLKLGRMIHARGMATHVPANGSVRSGAVELFLAGSRRSVDDGAEFAVHAWEDEDGKQPADFAANSPENRAYLDYYREMGMTAEEAAAFYNMTNSVPNADAKWLTAADMRHWVRLN